MGYSMDFYKNLNGTSGVSRYQITPTSVLVEFKGGKVYEYSYESAGSYNIEKMKMNKKLNYMNLFIIFYIKFDYNDINFLIT
jgi:hypothetical protein